MKDGHKVMYLQPKSGNIDMQINVIAFEAVSLGEITPLTQ